MYEERYFESTDGLKLFYRDYAGPPTRPAVLCLPGLTRNSQDFAELAEHLCVRRRVLAADLRGRGRSAYDPVLSHYNPTTYLSDVMQLLSVTELTSVVVVGTSLGGFLAMMLVAAKSEAVIGIVVNDIGPEIDPRGLERIQGYVGQGGAAATWDEATAAMRGLNESVFPDWNDDDWRAMAKRTYRRDKNGQLRLDYDAGIAEAFGEPAGAAPAADIWPIWSLVGRVPSLGIRGELSDILAPETFERMRAEHDAFEGVVVPRVGHAPMLTEPICVEAIDRFLEGLD